jgi:hypothetical protein
MELKKIVIVILLLRNKEFSLQYLYRGLYVMLLLPLTQRKHFSLD